MTPKFKFADGERVLCFHGPLIYEAKALKSTVTKDKQIKYYIHYAGWNKNWDEWVPENRVLKYNEANVQRQKEVFKQHSAASKNKKSSSKNKKGDTSGSESRASTPSKDTNTPLAAPNSATVSTPVGVTASSRSNRATKSTVRPSTPSGKDSGNGSASETPQKKDDAPTKDELTAKDDNNSKDEMQQKKKRGGSHTSDKSASTNASSTPTPPIGAGSANTNTPVSATALPSSGRVDSCVESEESFLAKIEVKIKIPDELKQCLTDDWDAITRQHKLIDIPAKVTVQDIVDQYIAFKKSAKSTNATKEVAINDVLNGIVEYFNVMLGSQLLYKFERPQYADILQNHTETPLSKLYGAFHLLRLFVKLGSMLTYSALDEKSMQMLLVHLHDFLKFLVKNSTTYFTMANFVNVDPAYVRHTQ